MTAGSGRREVAQSRKLTHVTSDGPRTSPLGVHGIKWEWNGEGGGGGVGGFTSWIRRKTPACAAASPAHHDLCYSREL